MQITKINNTVPADKKTNSPVMYKPYVKVYRNALEINFHLKKLMGLKDGDGISFGFGTEEGIDKTYLVVFADETSSLLLHGAGAEKFHLAIHSPPNSKALKDVGTVIDCAAKMNGYESVEGLPYPFFLTTGEKHKICAQDGEIVTTAYRLKFETL